MIPSDFTPNQDSKIRLELAGTGQMASPLQSCWVMANILFDLQKQGLIHDVPAPRHVISKLCQTLIKERDVFWNSQKKNKYMEIFERELQSIDHPIVFLQPDDPMNEEESFTQTLKEVCPTIEATLISCDKDETKETTKKKGKGGSIPSRQPALQPIPEHSFVQIEQEHSRPRIKTEQSFVQTEQKMSQKVCFPTNGGVPGFETGTKKRQFHEQPTQQTDLEPIQPEDRFKKIKVDLSEAKETKIDEYQQHAEIEHVQPDLAQIETEIDLANQKVTDQKTCLVMTALPFERLTVVKCHENHTVGQFALAEADLMGIQAPLRTTDLVGSHIPIGSQIQNEQIILLNPSLDDFQKCPRQTTASECPDLAHLTRFDAVWHQKGWVAWDEMEFYLSTFEEDLGAHVCKPIDFTKQIGIESEEPVFVKSRQLQEASNHTGVFTAGWYQQHWFPMHVIYQDEGWLITIPSELQFMVQDNITTSLSPSTVKFQGCSVPSKFGADCGFQTIAWIMHQITPDQSSLPMPAQEAIRWRLLFAETLTNNNIGSVKFGKIKLGGMNESQIKHDLTQLVESHGVSPSRSQECVNHLIRVLGMTTIQSVLASGNPWKDLKTRATTQSPPIQIVLTSELQQAIVARTKAGLTFGSRKNKKKENHPKQPFRIDAARIQVPPSIFQQQDGNLLSQISIEQLHLNSRGIVVTNIDEALPYLRLQEPICKEGMGMLG